MQIRFTFFLSRYLDMEQNIMIIIFYSTNETSISGQIPTLQENCLTCAAEILSCDPLEETSDYSLDYHNVHTKDHKTFKTMHMIMVTVTDLENLLRYKVATRKEKTGRPLHKIYFRCFPFSPEPSSVRGKGLLSCVHSASLFICLGYIQFLSLEKSCNDNLVMKKMSAFLNSRSCFSIECFEQMSNLMTRMRTNYQNQTRIFYLPIFLKMSFLSSQSNSILHAIESPSVTRKEIYNSTDEISSSGQSPTEKNSLTCGAAIPLEETSDFQISKRPLCFIDEELYANKCKEVKHEWKAIQLNLKEHRKEHKDITIVLKEPQELKEIEHKLKDGNKTCKELRNEIKGINLRKRKSSWSFFSPRTQSLTLYPVLNSSLHVLMRHEILRIRSYEKCSAQTISFAQLAQAGFYYCGPNGKVTCFACQSSHEGFLFGVVSTEAHGYGCQRAVQNIALSQGTSGLTSDNFQLFDSVYDISGSWESGYASKPGAGYVRSQNSSGNTGTGSQAQADEGHVYYVYTSATKDQPLQFNPYSKAWITSDNRSEPQGAEGGGNDEEPFLDLRGAAYPLFANRRTRRDTFHSWDLNHSQKPEELVNLGFFYAGYSDCARCFYCGLGLKYWRPNDNAAYQHARFRPQCLYNCFVKGQAYIDQVQREIANENQGRDRDQAENANGRVDAAPEVPNIDQLMRSDAVRQVLEENWTREQVREGVVKLIHDLGEECLVYDILSDVMQRISQQAPPAASEPNASNANGKNATEIHDGEKAVEEHDGESSLAPQVESDIERNSAAAASASTIPATTPTADVSLAPDLVLRLLEREHNYLKKRLYCMVCGANKIGCIYLPCGHVVACLTCGDLASTCVLCDKVISATANIYMS